ncbi:hypothetical protein EUA31_05205 [Neisseria meningitidis]|nr:hypothetical protein [Neisseria meningitidis]MBG8657899.1 hypothetical protein [Neisseria meningitidis]MBG8664769.1 hypothetical protein [Neisseria meningitidis]MBG8712601.1 hypothetical protein [Neisseria meningitidis]MBG8741960.1 hypothetical protein [Neisseria meningitidis]
MTNPSIRKPTPRHSYEPTSRHSHKNRNLKSRHSRAGGNLDLRTTVIFKDYLKVRDSGFPLPWE